MYHVGIDTSCYTTSIAVLDRNGGLVLDSRKLLQVKEGTRGLRQSDGLFQHIVNLEEMAAQLSFTRGKIKSVTASDKPRNEDGSYMPVFRGGSLAGSFLVAGTDGELLHLSHQEGHLFSALWSLREELEIGGLDQFLFLHVSGGTSEILLAERSADPIRYSLTLIGGTSDLNAGQFIDRVGVVAGVPFPCGKKMNEMLLECPIQESEMGDIPKLRITVRDGEFSLSGPETQASRMIAAGTDPRLVFRSVFSAVEEALYKGILHGLEKNPVKTVIVSGGVAANTFIREGLMKRLTGSKAGKGVSLYFPDIRYASDNAVGPAYFGYLSDRRGETI